MSYPFPGVEAGVGDKIAIEAFKYGLKLAIKSAITRILVDVLSSSAISSIMRNGRIDINNQNAIELKSKLGDRAFRKIEADLFDIENKSREILINLLKRRIDEKSNEMYNNEYFKKLKKFADDIHKKPSDPEQPQDPEKVCKYLKKFEQAIDASSLVIEFVAFILNKYIYEEEEEGKEITDTKILTTKLISSLLIPMEEWEKLISSPHTSKEVFQAMETIMGSDPKYSTLTTTTIIDENDSSLMGVKPKAKAGDYEPSTDVLRLVSVGGKKLVNLVGTSSDKRESSWVKFWESVTNNCDSGRTCRIQTESPVHENIHNPVTPIVGGHIRKFGDSVRDTFLILPICNSHNVQRRFDEDQTGSPYLVGSLKAVAAEIASVKLSKRKYHSLGFHEFNSTLEESLNQLGLNDFIKQSIQKDYFDTINPLIKDSIEEAIKWMEKEYAPTFDDIIPIIGDIKTIYQVSTMQNATYSKFHDILNDKFSKINPNVKMEQTIEKLISDNSNNFDLALSLFYKKYYTEEFY
ncbi:hypothetical protein DDB_G0290967 [Dictyostelium discoideum AX4]|uniref:Uncharacterized protein n=1 Tax=Dictyostelium discoideum TaxID=44689 RepID=Q54FC3_DICDI|nr:hypothetical protein DDB_G0290967 [Dictyostelium discoideum AX4]EAL61914.1 hypothetical protein DDB_G0290967 [Dictyostelium discoideum AX4]|eukprot:XP_635414.1 hypothetical protein DDB_G0290967 [Dictyostelium discoideum AX4]